MMGEMPAMDPIPADDLMTEDELAEAGTPIAPPAPEEFDANLAETGLASGRFDENYLNQLGQEICEMVEADLQSCAEWQQRFKRGLQIIGLTDYKWETDAAPFDGASTVVHPMLAEAGIQSQARAVEELLPAKGPAKTIVMGKETPDKRAAADRVADHMNYQLTIEDPVYFKDTNRLHLYNTWFGTCYRKALHDPLLDQNVLRFVRGEDLILPYDSGSYDTSPRLTHKFTISDNDLKRYAQAGAYRKIELQEPAEESPDLAKEQLDEVDAKANVRADNDIAHDIYETDLWYDLKGYEDIGADGKPTTIGLPYTVSVEKSSQKVMAIRRCWKERDALKRRRIRYAEYWYLPGLGSKGYGLLHLIGSLSEAATDSLRALLDSATWANLQGGFKSKDANVKAGEIQLSPGLWRDVDMTAEELQKAFYTPPFKEPSEALFKLLGLLTELGRRFSATTDLMVGEGSKGPVGTTIAMIEQGQKIYSSVHKRGHAAVGVELRMLFDLNSENMPEEGYPYQVPGDDLQVYRKDYDETMVGIVPVSDPNIFSQTQRIAQGQAQYQLFKENPQDFKRHEILYRVLDSLKVPEIDDVLIDTEAGPPPMDPVSENIAIATQRPVKAHEGENHQAHLAVHMSFMQHPQFGGIAQAQELIGPAMMAHMAEHVALLYADTMRGLGVPVPPANLSAGPHDPMVPPEAGQYGNLIAQKAQQMIGAFMQASGLSTPPAADAGPDVAAADIRLKDAQAFSAFAAGVSALIKAGESVQQGEAELAGLDSALGGNGAKPNGVAGPALPASGGGPPPPS